MADVATPATVEPEAPVTVSPVDPSPVAPLPPVETLAVKTLREKALAVLEHAEKETGVFGDRLLAVADRYLALAKDVETKL